METFLFILVILFIFLYGFVVGKLQVFPYTHLMKLKKSFLTQKPKEILIEGYADTSHKVQVDCSNIDKNTTMVILAFGQAHAGNSAETLYRCKHNVFDIYKDKCYKAEDPLLGASATNEYRGTVWSRVGDKIIEEGLYQNVIVKTVAVAGTPIACWTTEGKGFGWGGQYHGNYHYRIIDAKNELQALGFEITHVCWIQGESDTANRTSTQEYKRAFQNILESLRHHGIQAPIYIALTSRDDEKFHIGEEVLRAQQELIAENRNVYEGANLNGIDRLEDRLIPSVNFSTQGVDKHTDAWLNVFKQKMRN